MLSPAATVYGQPVFQQTGNLLIMSNADVTLQYNLSAGTADFYWQNAKKISAFYAGVGLNTGYITGNNAGYSNRIYTVVGSNQVVVTSQGGGLPTMKQYFTLDQNDSFLTKGVSVSASTNLVSNWMGAPSSWIPTALSISASPTTTVLSLFPSITTVSFPTTLNP